MIFDPERFLRHCFSEAVNAADPHHFLGKHLPTDKDASVVVIGAGKAAASMAAAFEHHWQGEIRGAVIVPYGHGVRCKYIDVIEASHPVPDEASINAANHILSLTNNLEETDQVYVLLSGGGSALMCLPAAGINFNEKQEINRLLLKSGADIAEINTVRKHLSAVKGGRLAVQCQPAHVYTLSISDVTGDDPAVIASGPTVAAPTTSADAIEIIDKYSIKHSDTIRKWLSRSASETPKSISNSKYTIIRSASDVLKHIEALCESSHINCINLGELEGDARALGQSHAQLVNEMEIEKPTLIISGGETTVEVRSSGRGGRNTEYLLSFFISLGGAKNIYALAADTDGIDGSEDNAGALITPETHENANAAELDLKSMLDNNDSYCAFQKLNNLIITGPTKTNVNDFRAILILPNN